MAVEGHPKVAIVILNWNGKEFLLDCLRSFETLEYPEYEIIVVDNASRDGSVQEIEKRFPHLPIIANQENLGFAGGNNTGIELALRRDADYVMLLNNDTLLRNTRFLDRLVDYMESHRDVAATSPLILYPSSDLVWSAGGKLHILLGMCSHIGKRKEIAKFLPKNPYEADYLPGCCIMARREALMNTGLLDPDYFLYYEDLDWCWRARQTSGKCVVVPVDAIYHAKSGTAGRAGSDSLSPTQAFFFARNGIRFARKNLKGPKKISFLIGVFSFNMLYCVLHMRSLESVERYVKGIAAGFSRTGNAN